MRVLFADADLENIKNFKTYIKNSYPEINIVGNLSSIANLHALISEQMPNLIVADIRFFSLNFNLVKQLHTSYPEMIFIIYGNYSDTEYMEKTLEFGVVDFIYKPVKPSELDRCLKRAILAFSEMEKAKQKQSQLEIQYKKDIAFFKDRFLTNILQGNITDNFEIANSMQYFKINLVQNYTVFIVRIDHYKKIILALDEMEKHLLTYKMQNIINQKLNNLASGVCIINRLNSISVILGATSDLSEIIRICEDIRTEIYFQTKRGVTIGVGRTYSDLSEISISYYEADAALRYRHIMGYNTVIPIHFVEPLNFITYKYPHEKEELLIYAAVTGEFNNCNNLLKQIISALKSAGQLPDRLVAKIIMNILISISRLASEQDINIESKFKTFFPFKQIFNIQTLDEAYLFLSNSLKDFCEYMILLRNENKQKIADKAKQYIDTKYFENISLSNIAVQTGTTPEFLNNIFMELERKSVYNYAICVRLLKAKEFMRESDLEDNLIAVNVGYDDVKHFRSVFRQHEGISTHEYRVKVR